MNVYKNSDPKELADLHPADRLMVKLIQIDRLAPRIEGMLYKCAFEERWSLLDEGARKLSEAGKSLLAARHFKELLSVRGGSLVIVHGSRADICLAHLVDW